MKPGRPFAQLTGSLKNGLQLAGWGAAVTIPAVVAVIFFSFAIFLWAERNYGVIDACLLMGAIFLVIAGMILALAAILRRGAVNRPASGGAAQWWKDPAIVAAGIELVRIVGIQRIIPVMALGAVFVGALESSLDRKHKREDSR